MDFSGLLLKSKETVNVSEIVKQLEVAQIVLDEKGLVDFTANFIFKDGNLNCNLSNPMCRRKVCPWT
jgi:hypothetical protein